MQKRITLFACIVLLILLSVFLYGCQIAPVLGKKSYDEKLIDGVYEGSYRRGPNKAVVKVTIKDGKIDNVELVRHAASWIGRKAGGAMPKRIVENQATNVDAVTGATNSSRVIMNAAHAAIGKACEQSQ